MHPTLPNIMNPRMNADEREELRNSGPVRVPFAFIRGPIVVLEAPCPKQ